MKLFKRTFSVILFLIVCVLILKWKLISQSYHWLYYGDFEKRSYYFQNQEKVFDHRTVNKSKKPFVFPKRKNQIDLPSNFNYQDSIIDTKMFIQDMGYEGIIALKSGEATSFEIFAFG